MSTQSSIYTNASTSVQYNRQFGHILGSESAKIIREMHPTPKSHENKRENSIPGQSSHSR